MALKDWDPADEPTDAPVVGEVSGGFRSLLDENPSRLPTLVADAGAIGEHWLAAASVTGLGHQHHARTGQDSYAFAAGTGCLVAAVADGLGSRPSSHLGATAAARLLCDELRAVNPCGWWGYRHQVLNAIERVSNRLAETAERLQPRLAPHDLATTTAFCVVADGPGRRDVVAGRVGDCGVFTLQAGEWSSVFSRDEGPTNIVHAYLPGSAGTSGVETTRIRLDHHAVLILATDELANDLFTSPQIRESLAARWERPVTTFHMLETLRYRRQGSHDDRTALVVWSNAAPRQEAHVPVAEDSV